MTSDLKYYLDMSMDAVKSDEERDLMFAGMDDMYDMEWPLGEQIRKAFPWTQKIVSSDAHDALRATGRIFSSKVPVITVWPPSDDVREMKKADLLEKALRWFVDGSMMQGEESVLSNVVTSAAKYDEICGQIIFHPYQRRMVGGYVLKTKDKGIQAAMEAREEAMEMNGPFSVVMRNPRHVHPRYGAHILESVVYAAIWEAQDVVDYYGAGAQELQTLIDRGDANDHYAVFDASDFRKRYSFVVPVPSEASEIPSNLDSDSPPKELIVVLDKENDLKFIPWNCAKGGSSIEADEGAKRMPMLYSVWKSGQYNVQNVLDTLVVSEAIAHAASARGKKSGPGAENIQMESMDPSQDVVLGPGQEYDRLEPPRLDEALFTLSAWNSGKTEKSTVPRVLQGGNIPSDVFATLNLAVTSGLVTVDPYKRLSERWLSKACRQMLQWIGHEGEAIDIYEYTHSRRTNKKVVKTFKVSPKDSAPKGMRIETMLQASTPVDEPAKLAAARQAVEVGLPRRTVLQGLGESDATGAMREQQLEALDRFFLERFMTRTRERDKMQDEIELMRAKAGIDHEVAAAAAPEGGPRQRPGPAPSVPELPPTGAEGNNPAEGEAPPALSNPEATRETQTGQSQTGEGLV